MKERTGEEGICIICVMLRRLVRSALQPSTSPDWTTIRSAVLKDMRLPGSNVLFGLPVVLDTNRADLVAGKTVALNFQVGREHPSVLCLRVRPGSAVGGGGA